MKVKDCQKVKPSLKIRMIKWFRMKQMKVKKKIRRKKKNKNSQLLKDI